MFDWVVILVSMVKMDGGGGGLVLKVEGVSFELFIFLVVLLIMGKM